MRDYIRGRYSVRGAPDHLWVGTSVENGSKVSRIHHLRQTPAQVRFLSIEPLIGPIPHLPLDGIDWVIVGGESGPGHRPIRPEWVHDIRNQCEQAGVAFFFKQWCGKTPQAGGRLLDRRVWSEMASARRFPA